MAQIDLPHRIIPSLEASQENWEALLTKLQAYILATAPSGGGGAPTGPAGGSLDGTYPNPGIANSVAGTGLTEAANVLSVNYGTSGTTATVGNDSRVVNAMQNTLVDAKGDVISATADNTPVRKAVGANGTVLTADSTQADGLNWSVPSAGASFLAVSKWGVD